MRSAIPVLVLIALLLILLTAGCSKSPSLPTQVVPEMRFTPAVSIPGANSITMQSIQSTATSVTVAARINTDFAVVGVSFWITFDPGLVVLTSASEGDFLSRNGFMTAFLWNEDSSGVLKISCSRLQTSGRFEGQTGQGELFRLSFSARGSAGTSSVIFSNEGDRQTYVGDSSSSNIASRFQIAGGTINITR